MQGIDMGQHSNADEPSPDVVAENLNGDGAVGKIPDGEAQVASENVSIALETAVAETVETEHDTKYKYDAFISYRHVHPDFEVAEKLHTMIETFKVPKGVKVQKSSDFHVFRDREELASGELGTSIDRALAQSRFLIVICSNRTPDSPWCRREITEFRRTHPDTSIIAVLVEGDPSTAFPPELKDLKTTVINAEGESTNLALELLAADVRPEEVQAPDFAGYAAIDGVDDDKLKSLTKDSLGILKKSEIFRVMATLLGVSLGDLTQRQKERRQKRLIMFGSVIGVALTIFGVSMTSMFLAATRAERNATDKAAQMLVNSAVDSAKDGDRSLALARAEAGFQAANPKMEGYSVVMAKYKEALTLSTVYPAFSGITKIDSGAATGFFDLNPAGDKLVVGGRGNTAVIYGVPSGAPLATLNADRPVTVLEWTSDDEILLGTGKDSIDIYDPASQEKKGEIKLDFISNAFVEMRSSGVLVALGPNNELVAIDLDTRQEVYRFDDPTTAPVFIDGTDDANILLVSHNNGVATMYKLDTGEKIKDVYVPENTEYREGDTRASISDDGKTIFLLTSVKVYWYDVATSKLTEVPNAFSNSDSAVSLTANGSMVAWASLGYESESATLLFKGGKEVRLDFPKKERFTSVNMTEDAKSVMFGTSSGNIYVFNVEDGLADDSLYPSINAMTDYPPHGGQVQIIKSTHDSSYVMSSGLDGTIQITAVKGTENVASEKGLLRGSSPNGKYFFVVDDTSSGLYEFTDDGHTKVRDVPFAIDSGVTGSAVRWRPTGAVSNDGLWTAVYSIDGTMVGVQDTRKSTIEYSIARPYAGLGSAARDAIPVFGKYNQMFVGSQTGQVDRYDGDDTIAQSYDMGTAPVIALSIDPDSKYIGATLRNGTFAIADTESGDVLESGTGSLLRVNATGTGFEAYIIDDSQLIRIVDGKRTVLSPITAALERGDFSEITATISPDGTVLAALLSDNTVALIDPESGGPVRILKIQGIPIVFLGISPDGSKLVYTYSSSISWEPTETRVVDLYTIEELEIAAKGVQGERKLPESERIK